MGRPLKWTPEQKLPLVLSVLRGEGSVAEVGRRHQVSDVTLAKWRDAFLAGGAAALDNGSRHGQSGREAELEAYKERLWIFSGKHTGAKDSWGGDIWTMIAAP